MLKILQYCKIFCIEKEVNTICVHLFFLPVSVKLNVRADFCYRFGNVFASICRLGVCGYAWSHTGWQKELYCLICIVQMLVEGLEKCVGQVAFKVRANDIQTRTELVRKQKLEWFELLFIWNKRHDMMVHKIISYGFKIMDGINFQTFKVKKIS